MIVADIAGVRDDLFATMIAIVRRLQFVVIAPFAGWFALYICAVFFDAAVCARGAGADRCAFAHDRARDRCLHQHRDGEIVLAQRSRNPGYVKTAMQEFHDHGLSPMAHDHRF